jgi:hypothetical protein
MTSTMNGWLTAVGRLTFFLVAIGLLPSQVALAQRTATSPCGAHADSLEVTDFGAKGDGSSDNLESFKAALAYASHCSVPQVHVPAGTYAFVPTGAAAGLLLPSNIALVGDGIGKTVLQVTAAKPGANFDSLLWARNQDNIQIRGMTMVGNNIVVNNASGQPLNTYGTAISIALDEKLGAPAFGTPRDLKQFTIADCQFENFNGAAWLRVTNYHPSYVISNIEIRHNMFRSHPGNAVNPSNIGFTSFAIQVTGSRTSAAGLVKGVRISGNNIEATHIKGGVGIYAGVADAVIAENTIVNAGADASIPDDRGAYAISVYQNAYRYDQGQAVMLGGAAPDDVHIERNVITRPRSCGIYTAAVNRVWVVGNKISGQTDGNNQTLPKGAIVMNHPTEGTVTDNQLSSNHIGMSVLTDAKGRVAASNNNISDVPRGGVATVAPQR